MVYPDGVAPSLMASVSASFNLPLRNKVQKFSSGTGSPRWSRKKVEVVVVVLTGIHMCCISSSSNKRGFVYCFVMTHL